jgi:hypothetical protein
MLCAIGAHSDMPMLITPEEHVVDKEVRHHSKIARTTHLCCRNELCMSNGVPVIKPRMF